MPTPSPLRSVRDALKSVLPAPVLQGARQARDFGAARGMYLGQSGFRSRATAWTRAVRPAMTVLYYPQVPVPETVHWKLCAVLGFRITGDPARRHDVAVQYQHITRMEEAGRLSPNRGREVLNGACTDISKDRISRAFEEVFGYPLLVDPATYGGPVVRKSDLNAKHDGELIDCPIPPEDVRADCVYQREVDNVQDNGIALDLRVPVHGGRLPLVYRKQRARDARFARVASAELSTPEAEFSARERTQLLKFARHIGMDCGEFDVLRDKADGRIYVVDANDTPWGPTKTLSLPQQRRAVEILAQSFSRMMNEHRDGSAPWRVR